MRTNTNSTGTWLAPALRFRKLAAAVNWLCSAFITAVDGTIPHARLIISIAASVVVGFIAMATVGWLLMAFAQPMPNGEQRGLAFRASAPLPHTEEAAERTSPRAGERTQVNTLSVRTIDVTQRTEEASEATAQQAAELAPLSTPASAVTEAPQRTDEGSERTARQMVEQPTLEETFKQLPAAQQATTAPLETRKQVAKASPDAGEQRLVREQAAKEAAAKEAAAKVAAAKEAGAKQAAERARDARKAAAEAERVKMSAAQPATTAAKPSPTEQNADPQGGWDCVPSPPLGQIVCHPPAKKAASAKAPAAPKPNLFDVELTKSP